MKNPFSKKNAVIACVSNCKTLLGVAALTGALLAGNSVLAQTTNAFDQASDPAYAGLIAPNGLDVGGQNGGYGFGVWTFTLTGTGGSFIQNSGPSGSSFDLWNNTDSGSTVAQRPLSIPLSAGQSFSIALRLNGLDNQDTNRFALLDADGNILFSYWHHGGDNLNGWYSDATTNNGVAVNFPYSYQSFNYFRFTLTSPTTYTFTDLSSGGSFSGTIANTPIAQFTLSRLNGSPGPNNGEDFQFDQLLITSAAPASFSSVTPAPDSLSASVNGPISAQVISGGVLLNTNVVSMNIDGNSVTPIVGGSSSVMTVSYTPNPAFNFASQHTVQVIVQDDNSIFYTNSWSFTTGYSTLPVTLAGPLSTGGGTNLLIFSATGDPWLDTNYGVNSSRTIYARFSMAFTNSDGSGPNLNNEDGINGGGFGGLHFMLGTTEKLIIGNAWVSTNWSLDAGGSQQDINPVVPLVMGDWHTLVVRVDQVPDAVDKVTVYFDPDFTETEAAQVNVYQTTADATFDNIKLRCGNGVASATWTNIIIASTSAGVGFVAPADPTFQSLVPYANDPSAYINSPISAQILFGSYGIDSNNVTLNLDGNNVTPSFVVTTNSITVNYQPPTPFATGSTHTVTLSTTDSNNSTYSTTWSFTADMYPTLPVSVAGPIDVSGGSDVTLWTSQNGWIANNYEANSTNTLYTRFSMVFYDYPQTVAADGGSYGGLHFFQGDATERLLIGNAWTSTNWSADAKEAGEPDLLPITPIVVNEWHTMVVKSIYASNAPTSETIWLDPDFTKSLDSQPQAPLTVSMDNTFNEVRLRCGNDNTFAEFTNVVIAATDVDLGFPASVAPSFLSITHGQLSWTGSGTLQSAPAVTGPWNDFNNQANPQVLSTTNSAQFFRLRQ